MLVLACPCALVIAAPIPAVCAIATAAKNKVLVRGAKRLHLALDNVCLIFMMAFFVLLCRAFRLICY